MSGRGWRGRRIGCQLTHPFDRHSSDTIERCNRYAQVQMGSSNLSLSISLGCVTAVRRCMELIPFAALQRNKPRIWRAAAATTHTHLHTPSLTGTPHRRIVCTSFLLPVLFRYRRRCLCWCVRVAGCSWCTRTRDRRWWERCSPAAAAAAGHSLRQRARGDRNKKENDTETHEEHEKDIQRKDIQRRRK